MKHLITAGLLFMSAASFAQHRQLNGDPITSHANVLNLRADQKSKLDSMNKAHRAQMNELRKNDSLSTEAKRQQQATLQKQHHEQSLAVLDAEQVTMLKKIREDDHRKTGGDMDTRRMQKQLNLTEDQVTKLKAMQEQNQQEMKQLRNDTSVTEANKRIRMEELRKGRKQELESILTPEQQKKFKEMRGPRGKTSSSE